MLMLLLLACTDTPADKSRVGPLDSDEPVVVVDDDGDGYNVDEDCDDSDPAIHPGATEVCDGVDQDCSGVADDGIISDGAGCQDPGRPARAAAPSVLHLVARTGTGTYDGTNDGATEICLKDDLCWAPYKDQWDDLEPGVVDVIAIEDIDFSWDAPNQFTVRTDNGSNLWRPVAFQASLDGELIHCRDGLDIEMGSDSGETPSWTDPDGLGVHCVTAFDEPLTHGPIVGATFSDRAQIWFRTDSTRKVELFASTELAELATASPVSTSYPPASTDFTQTVQIVGLPGGQEVHYELAVDGQRFGPWSFTPPAVDAQTLSFGMGSCSKLDEQPIFAQVIAQDLELFLFLGDNHYGNTNELSDLRQFYRWAHERSYRAAMMAEVPTLAIWDDHDYVDNNENGYAEDKDVNLRVFQEYWANTSYGTDAIDGVFSTHRVGPAEFFLLDDRYYRDLDDSVLGDAQEAWLYDQLIASDAAFKFVVTGSQFTQEGSDDSWQYYPEATQRLHELIVDQGIGGVVFVSGDVHQSELILEPSLAGGYAIPELTSSPLAYEVDELCWAADNVLECYGGNNFIRVDVDASVPDATVTAQIIDEAGGIQAEWVIYRSELE